MLVFSISDKGGTGRSVTSCNLAFRLALDRKNVAYLDFDFGSPTAGALFEIGSANRGTPHGNGMHEYLLGNTGSAARLDVRTSTDRPDLRAAQTRWAAWCCCRATRAGPSSWPRTTRWWTAARSC